MNYISTAIGLTIANFGYAAVMYPDWSHAVERTLFQLVALFAAWLTTSTMPAFTRPDST